MIIESIKVLIVFGTRPEAIKLIPVIKKLENDKRFNLIVCNTSQHKELLSGIISNYDIPVNYDLNIMKKKQTLDIISTKVTIGVTKLLNEINPDFVIVHGDTTTAFGTSLAAFYKNIKILHIEAGLRTFDRMSPFPEEFNRSAISLMSYFHFAPTQIAYKNLIEEKVNSSKVLITGNTVIDQAKMSYDSKFSSVELVWVKDSKFILFTAHRRENIKFMDDMFSAMKSIMLDNKDLKMIYPVHMNPIVRELAIKYFQDVENVLLTSPLSLKSFHNLMARSYIVVSDSGGVQEEASYFGIPVVLMRTSTERPEGLGKGIILAGVNYEKIQDTVNKLISNNNYYKENIPLSSPFGDGNASNRIIEAIVLLNENSSI